MTKNNLDIWMFTSTNEEIDGVLANASTSRSSEIIFTEGDEVPTKRMKPNILQKTDKNAHTTKNRFWW